MLHYILAQVSIQHSKKTHPPSPGDIFHFYKGFLDPPLFFILHPRAGSLDSVCTVQQFFTSHALSSCRLISASPFASVSSTATDQQSACNFISCEFSFSISQNANAVRFPSIIFFSKPSVLSLCFFLMSWNQHCGIPISFWFPWPGHRSLFDG